MNSKLWYNKPASDWLDGLPIGNGRIAAMVLGQYPRERIALNHEWLWTGINRNRDVNVQSQHLPEVRKLLLEGDYKNGTALANKAFAGGGGKSGTPNRVDNFQTAGDLWIDVSHGPISSYHRKLDLKTATATTSYKAHYNNPYSKTCIAHLEEDMILIHLAAGRTKIDAAFSLSRLFSSTCQMTYEAFDNTIIMRGDIKDGIDFCVRARIFNAGGELKISNNREITVAGASEILVAVNIGTSGNGKDSEAESAIRDIDPAEWPELLKQNIASYSKHYDSMTLELPVEDSDLPTDERVEKIKKGEQDDGLPLLYFNYARYLLFASSALGELPANLQGKWCENLLPPWSCDYHHDINLQMNYWLAEPSGMQTACKALFRHIERFVPHAREVARKLYDCDGVYFPLQTDPWGRATPESYGWAAWNGAAAWLAQHFWWHFQYSQDLDFLRDRAYPFFKEAAAFFESFMIEDEDGIMQIVPSQSPENRFKECGDDFPVAICVSAAMDVELVWDLLHHAVAASEKLNVDEEKRETWKRILHKLPPLQIGSKGQLLEWNKEFEENEPGHRHISHLYALFPGDQIDPELTPELFKAAEKSLELRLESFGGHTGWSRAWMACCFARLRRGNDAFGHLEHLITDFASITLLDLHPPRIFQIDGNLGGGAAVIEMLFQSYQEELHFLPALPDAWPEGKITGLRARGGFTIDFSWKDGKLVEAIIKSITTKPCTILNLNTDAIIKTENGDQQVIQENGNKKNFTAQAGVKYILTIK